MAKQINITGKVDIQVQLATGAGNLLDLGESEDMADVDERVFLHNVPGDAHGGPQGPPIDVQYLGSIYVASIRMSRWDPTTLDLLRTRIANTTLGTVADGEVGTLLLTSGPRLVLKSTTRPINFPCCIIREAISYGMGTKYTSAILQFEAHRTPANHWSGESAGLLHNTDTTEYV